MENTVAALQISDSGIKVLVGGVEDRVFHSWHHDMIEIYMNSKTFNKYDFELRLKSLIKHVQAEIGKIINSWYIVYDINEVEITKMECNIGDIYTTKASIKDIQNAVLEQCSDKELAPIALPEILKYKWIGKNEIVVSNSLPEPGVSIRDLRVLSVIYRSNNEILNKLKSVFNENHIHIERFIPSCLCYPHILTQKVGGKKWFSIVDIGNNTTKIMIYKGNSLLDYKVIDKGSYTFTSQINRKYQIGSERKTVNLIKEYFTFTRLHKFDVDLNVSHGPEGNIILTRDDLRRVLRKGMFKLHKEIENYIMEYALHNLNKASLPIFVTGGITNAKGYNSFLRNRMPTVKHLNIETIENIDNGFAALIGFADLTVVDLDRTYGSISCISDNKYNLASKIGLKLKHTDKWKFSNVVG